MAGRRSRRGSGEVAAAGRLAEILPQGVGVVSSPLRRCTQLAQALALLRPDLVPTLDARLAEMDFGSWEGRAWNGLDRDEIEAWANDFVAHRPGGTGECVATFVARIDAILQETRSAGRDQAWIAHGGVYKVLVRRLEGLELARASDWPVETLEWGDWHMFQIDA